MRFINMKSLFAVSLLVCLSFTFNSCYEPGEVCCENHTLVTVVDYTGLDGCGLVLLTEDDVLEAYNLTECGVIPEEGMRLCVDYEEIAAVSICMVGPKMGPISFVLF